MDVKLSAPEWIENGTITVRLTELNPHATAALIESLRDSMDADDDRVQLLIDLWDSLTGD